MLVIPVAWLRFSHSEFLLSTSDIDGGSGTANTATAVPKFDKWGLSRTRVGSEQFRHQPVLT